MLTRQLYIQNIADRLAYIKAQIELTNSISLYDLNIHSESFFCQLLNIIYDYKLINLNSAQRNYNSIDLADEKAKLSVQITSDNSSTKITKTIKGFIDNKHYEKYDRLVILILGNKKNYKTRFDTQGKFMFSKEKDIIDIESIIKEIQYKEVSDLKSINDFFESEFSPAQSHEMHRNFYEKIERMRQRAMALCLSKLKSVGVSHKAAALIIEKDISNCKFEYVLKAAEQGKNYLVGDFGTGKSHVISILALRLIKEYLSGNIGHIPLFAQVHEIIQFGGIQNWAEQNEKSNKYFILIDGLDEVDFLVSEKIVEEIKFLKELWPDSRFIIGSRPISSIIGDDEKYFYIEALSNSERCELFSIISGENITNSEYAFLHLDEKLNKILFKPFFCIIYALFKAEPRSWAKKDIDLVTAFINKSIEKCKVNKIDVYAQLEQIAILSVDYNLGRVHKTELRAGLSIEDVLKTGFVTQSYDGYFSFPLPIVAQWLAAEGIRHRRIEIESILVDEDTASRWRYPLSILFSQMSYEESLELFTKIIKKMPGIASIIIRDGIRFGNIEEFPAAYKCGVMIRTCMQVWIDALGPLSQFIAPVGKNGLYNLAIYVEPPYLTTTWADRKDEDSIVVLPYEEHDKWVSTTYSRGVPMQSTWPWVLTFEYLSDRLKEVIEARSILIENGLLEAEYTWHTSLSLLGKGSLFDHDIDISATDSFRHYIGKRVLYNGKSIQFDLYFSIIDKLLGKGETIMHAPYPAGDRDYSSGNGFVWSKYSKERMLALIQFIYSNALSEYENLVNACFITLKDRMPVFSLLPCKFKGYLKYDQNVKDWNSGPKMTWYIEAIPSDKKNEVMITYDNEDTVDVQVNLLSEIHQNNIKYRPLKRSWINSSITTQRLNCFTSMPVTDIVYNWLKNDLKKIGWIDR